MRGLMLMIPALLVLMTAPTLAQDGAAWPALQDVQRSLHHDLAQAVRALGTGEEGGGLPGRFLSGLSLILLSFGYGVFHAVGPGHGKAVIATYAAASGARLRRAVWMAMLAALVQGTTAVVLVGAAFALLENGARWAAREAERLMEPISAAAIAIVGLLILWRVWRQWSHARHHRHDHHHHDHEHHHHHDGACCGHDHAPLPAAGDTPRQAALAALAVGLRPCSGAILVLVVAFGLKLWTAGIVSAYAMALGTGITVAGLAALARGSRHLADRLSGGGERAARWGRVIAALGGLALLGLGAMLLVGSLTRPSHPLL